MKKKRAKFLSALKSIEQAAAFNRQQSNKNVYDIVDYLDDHQVDDGYEEDTLRSMEVSFVEDNPSLPLPLPPPPPPPPPPQPISTSAIRHSLSSRTSTPIYVRSSPQPQPPKQHRRPPPPPPTSAQSSKCCKKRLICQCHSPMYRQLDAYYASFSSSPSATTTTASAASAAAAASSASYLTTFAGQFQDYGEFRVWFV